MFANLLAENTNGNSSQQIVMWVILIVVIVAFVAWFMLSGKKNKQSQKEYEEQLAAIRPGHKVKTAGGICGIVVEVCDDNTVIIETGSEQSGKSYIKMDKELIAQTDAKGPTQIAREQAEAAKKAGKNAKADAETPAPAEEPATEEPASEEAEQPVEEKKD